jgi:hypothetical protein
MAHLMAHLKTPRRPVLSTLPASFLMLFQLVGIGPKRAHRCFLQFKKQGRDGTLSPPFSDQGLATERGEFARAWALRRMSLAVHPQ